MQKKAALRYVKFPALSPCADDCSRASENRGLLWMIFAGIEHLAKRIVGLKRSIDVAVQPKSSFWLTEPLGINEVSEHHGPLGVTDASGRPSIGRSPSWSWG